MYLAGLVHQPIHILGWGVILHVVSDSMHLSFCSSHKEGHSSAFPIAKARLCYLTWYLMEIANPPWEFTEMKENCPIATNLKSLPAAAVMPSLHLLEHMGVTIVQFSWRGS